MPRRGFQNLSFVRSRLDEDDVDSERIDFVGYRLGPSLESPFRSTVDRIGRLTGETRLARDNDDTAFSLRAKSRQKRPSQLQHAKKIRLNHAPYLGSRQILERAGDRDARVVHHRIDFFAVAG